MRRERASRVDLDLTDDQQMFQSTTRRFLQRKSPMSRVRSVAETADGFDRTLWASAADLGWFAALVPEADGGGSVSGAPVADAAIIAEEVGRSMFAGPVLPTNIAAYAIASAGSSDQRSEHLPSLVSGERIATWAFVEPNGRWDVTDVDLRAEPDGGSFRLSGIKSLVQDAAVADLFVVSARTAAGPTQFLVPRHAAGITVSALESLDLARRFATVEFDNVEVPSGAVLGDVGDAAAAIEAQLDLATALVCAETVGALDRCYEMTMEYAQARRAFGRPIGSFQAIKHRLVDLTLWLESSKAITAAAVHAVDVDIDRSETVSIAKSYVSDRGPAIVRDCLQIHGGIGYTWEFDLHFYLRRVESNAALFGGVDHHQDRLAELLGVWEGTVAR